MLILNADDWGRTAEETEAAAECFRLGRLSSVTAMVFMRDSERAAERAGQLGLDVGLHLNLIQPYESAVPDPQVACDQGKIIAFLRSGRFASARYSPGLHDTFQRTYRAQYDEFLRLYGRAPSHIDGHHHFHLCANMLVGQVYGEGTKLRPSFHFWRGEKALINRAYRSSINWWIRRRHRTPDYFFALPQCMTLPRLERVTELARTASVEIMTHPSNTEEREFLTGAGFERAFSFLELGTYSDL